MTDEPPKERRATDRQAAVGRENLLNFRPDAPGLKHGIYSVTNNGEVPQQIEGAQEITERVDGIIAEYISDLGGESALTAGRRSILASLRISLLVLELSARYISEHGLLDARGKPNALLSVVNSFGNSARLHAVALGLDRRSRDATPTLDIVLQEYRDKRQSESKENHENVSESHEEHQTS